MFHNSDEDGWEIGALAIYSLRLPVSGSDRHRLEMIAGLGLLDERQRDSRSLGGSIGAGYSYRF